MKYLNKKEINIDNNLTNQTKVNQINQKEYINYHTNPTNSNTSDNFKKKYEKRNIKKNDPKNNPTNIKKDYKSYQITDNQANYINKKGNSNQNIGIKISEGNSLKTNNISNNNSISNNNEIKIEQIGLPTPGQNANENKSNNICMNCKKETIDNENVNICKYCFKSKMIDELYSNYIDYIETNENYNYFNGNVEITLKRDEQPKIFTLKQAIREYNNIYNNENLTYDKVMNELKKKVCIICSEDIKDQNYKSPCNCHFCSKEHLVSYLKQINFYKDNKIYCFSCNEKYSEDMIFCLGILCLEYNIKFKFSIIRYFSNKLKYNCCICGKTLITENPIHSRHLTSSPNKNQKMANALLYDLSHNFCEKCTINSKFKCNVCKVNHYINQTTVANNRLK